MIKEHATKDASDKNACAIQDQIVK